MIAIESLTALILEKIKTAQKGETFFEEIYNNFDLPVSKNEFLFFIKPEITVPSAQIKVVNILDLITEKIKEFGLTIHNVKILSAKYLKQYNIIAQHYGVINSISTGAVANLSESAKEKFKEIYGKSIEEVKILGGSEFLDHYPNFNPYVLDYLWQNIENKKLAGGTYCEAIKVDDETIYVINGFHPRQLNHFTESGRSIIVMTLSGDLPWKAARTSFIGATNPANAESGSLRKSFLDQKTNLGLSEVSQGVNGVHLSAGPVEALIELKRYNSDFSDNTKNKEYTDFSFGKILIDNFPKQFEDILNNVNVTVDGKTLSVFDITEEKDAHEAILILQKHFS